MLNWFQYRKRYGLHAIGGLIPFELFEGGFNTASGMDCMQLGPYFQQKRSNHRFNTASGMDCMQ